MKPEKSPLVWESHDWSPLRAVCLRCGITKQNYLNATFEQPCAPRVRPGATGFGETTAEGAQPQRSDRSMA